jgi:DNA-binding transcriptional LysR family regulator
MDRFDAIQAFVRVVEYGSFTKAATSLHTNKTSVTQLIQHLEARLRVKLLNRTTRQVNVTADGAAYYERVSRILTELEDAETGLSDASALPQGRLRVDVPSPLASLVLIPALPQFNARYPDIEVHMGVSDRVVNLIDERVDCVIRGGELMDQSLMARKVADLTIKAYAAQSYLERAGQPIHPEELNDTHHRIIAYLRANSGQPYPYIMRRNHEAVAVHGRYVLAVNDGNAYLAAGLGGMGIVLMPTYLAVAQVARSALLPLFEDWRIDSMPLYLAYPPNRRISTKLRVFIDWVVELMERNAIVE